MEKGKKIFEDDCITFYDDAKEIELPKNIQKQMMEFFMRTSIPRKKANNKHSLSEEKEGQKKK